MFWLPSKPCSIGNQIAIFSEGRIYSAIRCSSPFSGIETKLSKFHCNCFKFMLNMVAAEKSACIVMANLMNLLAYLKLGLKGFDISVFLMQNTVLKVEEQNLQFLWARLQIKGGQPLNIFQHQRLCLIQSSSFQKKDFPPEAQKMAEIIGINRILTRTKSLFWQGKIAAGMVFCPA